jgi:hypothetical protein
MDITSRPGKIGNAAFPSRMAVCRVRSEPLKSTLNRPSWSRQRLPGSNVQGGAGVSLTQHSAVKGVREGRRLASAIECQAQNGAIELKQPRHDPASV